MARSRILYFFPHNPYPPKSGAHIRCLEMLRAMADLGYETILASSDCSSETAWAESSIRALEEDLVSDVQVYQLSRMERGFIRCLAGFYQATRRSRPISSSIHTPPGMRIWFARLFNRVHPKAVFMNYALWDGLVRHRLWRKTPRIVDVYDFFTLNMAMREALESYLPARPIRTLEVDDRVLDEGFYAQLGLAPDPEELQTFDKYSWAIAISDTEENSLLRSLSRSQVIHIPVTHEPQYIPNTYDGPAIFPTGPNPFNIQAYCYFAKRVLPQVLQRAESFCLRVTGYICEHVQGEAGITLGGFLPDLQAAYSSARFMLCPVLGGTGQQVKIVEAMANGLPVIALEGAAHSPPVQHGVNGFVARNAQEFAEYTIRLWKDKPLCRRMGSAAREVIATDFSQARLRTALNSILGQDRQVSRS